MSQINTCAGCMHWTPSPCKSGMPLVGTCRRYPPILNPDAPPAGTAELIEAFLRTKAALIPRWVRPVTQADDTCGEWRDQ